MDDLLIDSLNMVRDFSSVQSEDMYNSSLNNAKLRKKLERQESGKVIDADGLFKDMHDLDSDEELPKHLDDPNHLVGKPAPQRGRAGLVCPVEDNFSLRKQPDLYKMDTDQFAANSDSCSAVSSATDDGGRSSGSYGKRGFSSCSDDSDGTKKKLEIKKQK